jgi:hypothetical protein
MAGHVARMGDMRNVYIWPEILKGRETTRKK